MTDGRTVYPDIIIHHRGTDENLLVLEVKKSTNPESSKADVEKLVLMKAAIKYRHAVFIRFVTGTTPVGVSEFLAA